MTEQLALELIGDINEVFNSQRLLGVDETTQLQVLVKKSRFGYYLRRGDTICGLSKKQFSAYDPLTISLESAVDILNKFGKSSSKRPKNKVKVKVNSPKSKRTKDFDTEISTIQLTSKSNKIEPKKGKRKTTQEVDNDPVRKSRRVPSDSSVEHERKDNKLQKLETSSEVPSQVPRKLSGFNIYCKEARLKLSESAKIWKSMSKDAQKQYNDKAFLISSKV